MSQYGYISHSELAHHGVKGQKWGVRRYQNEDGTLTEAGKKRYGISHLSYDNDGVINKATGKRIKGLSSAGVYKYAKRKVYRGLIQDYKNSKRNGEITRAQYEHGVRNARRDARRAAEAQVGSKARKNYNLGSAMATAGTAAAIGGLMLIGNESKKIKRMRNYNKYQKNDLNSPLTPAQPVKFNEGKAPSFVEAHGNSAQEYIKYRRAKDFQKQLKSGRRPDQLV